MKREAVSPAPDLRYLQMLSRQYPTVQAASSEIINLRAILNLPKGTEHFISPTSTASTRPLSTS